MLLESLVKATVELQGFRVVTVTGDAGGLVGRAGPGPSVLAPVWPVWENGAGTGTPAGDGTFAMCPCGDCGGVALCAAARELSSVRRCACRVDALGQWETADDPRVDGDARHVGPGLALAAGRAAVPVLVGQRGHGRRGGGRLRPGPSGSRQPNPHRD